MYKRNSKKIYCCNCGKLGHIYKKCKEPITSFGVIAFKFAEGFENALIKLWKSNKSKDLENAVILDAIEKNIQLLLIRRKDTLGYVEFVRGRYNVNKLDMLMRTFNIMTVTELIKIKEHDFDYLWNDLWLINKGFKRETNLYAKEYDTSRKRFDSLKRGVFNADNEFISLDIILKKCGRKYTEQEWGLPKGRKNIKENYKQCAIREFEEETGVKNHDYELLDSPKMFGKYPLEELFIGTNDLRYKHIYYIAQCKSDCILTLDEDNISQVIEISDIRWFNYKEALNILRPYNKAKQNIIKHSLKVIKQYLLDKFKYTCV